MISIHALREERDIGRTASIPEELISIHALREERDLPLATSLLEAVISIHALREERDRVRDPLGLWHWNFNPRAPRGARQQKNTKQKSIFL